MKKICYKNSWLPLCCAVLVLGCTQTKATNKNRIETNSDISGPAYQSLLDKSDTLAKANPNVTVIDFGQTIQKRPLRMVRVQKAGSSSIKRPAILITEATHGNEFLDLGYRLLDWAATDSGTSSGLQAFLNKGGAIFIIPVLNPDGYEYHRTLTADQAQIDGGPDSGNSWGRMNANRVDINRDFPTPKTNFAGLSQPETQALTEIVRKEISAQYTLEFSLDYHCCIGEGALLTSYAYSDQVSLPAKDQQRYDAMAELFQKQMPGVQLGPLYAIAGYNANGTSMDYYHDTYDSISMTYEGIYATEGQRFESHRLFWNDAMASIAAKYQDVSGVPNNSLIPNDPSVRTAIMTENANGISFAVSHDSAMSARICTAGPDDCARMTTGFLNLSFARDMSGRKILMSSQQLLPVASSYSVVIYSQLNQPSGSMRFNLQKK